MPSTLSPLPFAALALALPVAAQGQNYADLPPLAPMAEAEVRSLPEDMRAAPVMQTSETVTTVDGIETITRTRWIESPPAASVPNAYAPAPAVFEREQWLEECRRRTEGQDKDSTGTIIGGLLGAIAGGFIGSEIAAVGDKTLGAILGVGGGGLIGGLLGSLFDGDDDEDRYDCEAALDAYLSQYGTPAPRIASREIAYPAYPAYAQSYAYPAYSYGYTYAPPPQMVLVPVRSEVQQQVVVRETERYETYTVPGAARVIPAPPPSPKMIKNR